MLVLADGEDAESALVTDANVFPVYRYRPLQLHLRVGHLHLRNTLSRFSEKRSETRHQTSTERIDRFCSYDVSFKVNLISTYLNLLTKSEAKR